MKIRRYKEKIICGAKTTMHITESDGREFDATLICEKSPQHFGNHREIKEWDSTNSVMVTFYSAGIIIGLTLSILSTTEYFVLFFGTSNPTPLYLEILGVPILILSIAGEISLSLLNKKVD